MDADFLYQVSAAMAILTAAAFVANAFVTVPLLQMSRALRYCATGVLLIEAARRAMSSLVVLNSGVSVVEDASAFTLYAILAMSFVELTLAWLVCFGGIYYRAAGPPGRRTAAGRSPNGGGRNAP